VAPTYQRHAFLVERAIITAGKIFTKLILRACTGLDGWHIQCTAPSVQTGSRNSDDLTAQSLQISFILRQHAVTGESSNYMIDSLTTWHSNKRMHARNKGS